MPPSPLVFIDPGHGAHDPGGGMPERPARIQATQEGLEGCGVAYELREPKAAERDDVVAVHSEEYLDWLQSYCAEGGGWIDADTPARPDSLRVALRAAGACCEAADAAMQESRRSFCAVRPPGHHARPDRAMGFCLINNVAVAAARTLSSGTGKVAIVDFDVHHGNGTQEMFWTEPRVLYVSIHQWPWYPWEWGGLEETGDGRGKGANVNIPMPEGSGDDVYLEAVGRIVLPVLERFEPELLIVSAGFDAHADDPLGGQRLSAGGFGDMSAALVAAAENLCSGRVFFALEGGYNLGALKEAAPAVMAALGGAGSAQKGEREETTSWLDPIVDFHLSSR